METTAIPSLVETLAPVTASAAKGRRIRFKARVPLRVKAARATANKFKHVDFKRMQAACRVPSESKRRSWVWVASVALHSALVAILSGIMIFQSMSPQNEHMSIVAVTFFEPTPEIPIVRPPELLLAQAVEVIEQEENVPVAQDEPKEESTGEVVLVDQDDKAAQPSNEVPQEVASADIIHSVEQDWNRVKYRGSARGVSASNVVSDAPVASGGATNVQAPVAPSAVNSNGQGQGTGGISRGAKPMGLSGGAYPKRAIKEKREGVVHLQVEVLANGRVGRIELHESSGHADLDATALEAAKKWQFQPALSNDNPVSTTVVVPVRYQLKDAR